MEQLQYKGRNLHFHVTGTLAAALVPWWINVFRQVNPSCVVNISVTQSAVRFVSPLALEKISNGIFWLDAWNNSNVPDEVHGGDQAIEAVIIFPASNDFISRLSQGRSNTPAMMWMQLFDGPIIINDTLPGRNQIIDANINRLQTRPNVRFPNRLPMTKATSGQSIFSGFNLIDSIRILNNNVEESAR